MIVGVMGGADVVSARQVAEPPAPLAVRYKDEADDRADKDLFALLKKFPEVVVRNPAIGATGRVTIRSRRSGASFAQSVRGPLRAKKGVLSSGFGMRRHPLLGGVRPHNGVDLAAPIGTPVVATADGVVRAAGRRGGYGLSVTLEHGRGMETRYAHMSRVNVAGGQRVRRGNVIGWVGSTGLSTGPHLHYETRLRGRAVDPRRYMRGK